MLRGLEVNNMLIIDQLSLSFEPGLNVLTGETGAGKSILLDALGFVLGWRGRADLVRSGAAQGQVVAWFDLPDDHPAREILAEAGLPVEDELILRRINTADGRKTAWVNDRRCSGEVLRQLSDTLLELHGQHDDRGLLDPRHHRAILDAFGGLDAQQVAVANAWANLRKARKAKAAAMEGVDQLRAEEEFLRHAVAEFDDIAPEPGEEEALDTRRRLMQAAEKIRDDIAKAEQVLGADGAEGAMAHALRWLDGVMENSEGRLDAPVAALNRAMVELDEANRGLTSALDELDFDGHELEACEERLFAIRALARKHNVAPDALQELAVELRQRLNALDDSDGDLVELQARLDQAEQAFATAAQTLTDARKAAAVRLDAAVMEELAPLKMERAVFATDITPEEPGASGRDAVTFQVATNPGAPAGPLNKIASGGELSRFLLALKVCLSQSQSGRTMIFDEIDRGVGGATADAVGRRLAALADTGQVLVVTHSPQVAALGSHHWRVEKSVDAGMTTSNVVPLAPSERVDEIARMLAGDTITDEARGAAKALLSR